MRPTYTAWQPNRREKAVTTKTELLQVRISTDQRDLLTEYSEATGAPISEIVRRAIHGCLQRSENGKDIVWTPASARQPVHEMLGGTA
jgi:Ribbon-helix-helix domain